MSEIQTNPTERDALATALSSVSTGLALGRDMEETARTLIHSRQNISPKRLSEPAPSAEQLEHLLRAAAAAPDHGSLIPWRFIIVPQEKRALLADVFARTLLERDPGAAREQLASAREKAYRGPLVLVAVAKLGSTAEIPTLERVISLGCAIQNILLSAHAMGYGGGLTSGQAMCSPHMRALLRLAEGEEAICFINIGTVTQRKQQRSRPVPSEFVSTL